MTTWRYLTVDDWGGLWARPPVAEHMPDGEVYIHHVGGGAWMGGNVGRGEEASRHAAISVFRNLNIYATRPKSEGGKGYSFLDYDALGWYDRVNDIGWIAEGRGPWRSAATLDRNEAGEAFVVCGNFSRREPLEQEIELAARGVLYMADQGWTVRDPLILGHKDNPAHPDATPCPGVFFYPELPKVRQLYAQLSSQSQEDLMTRMPVTVVRHQGTADVKIQLPVPNEEALHAWGLSFDDVVILDPLSAREKHELEERQGYDFTPHQG